MKHFELQAYLSDLKTLCAIDSGHGHIPGNEAMADWFETRYRALGLKTERRYYNDNTHAPMLLVTNTEEQNLDVVFVSHLDTVFAPGTAAEWPLTVDEKQIGHGPGCVDCKGGSLLIYYLLRAMLQDGDCRFRFCVAMNSDEETGSNFSRPYFEELAQRAQYCLVFEPGRPNDEFVGCRKAGNSYVVKCHGVTAHASVDPEKGASAILELSKWIPELYKLNDSEDGSSVNVGTFKGGVNNGSVPDYAEFTFGYKFLSDAGLQKLNNLIRKMQETPFDPRTTIIVEEKYARPGMFPHAATEQLFHTLREAGEELGQPVTFLTTGGASDGNWIAPFGVATLDGCGPCGGSLHTRNEYLKTWTVEPRLDLMRRLLNKLFP